MGCHLIESHRGQSNTGALPGKPPVSGDEIRSAAPDENQVGCSRRYPRYFETATGAPFVPIGLNLCFPRHSTTREEGLAKMLRWLDRLADSGGNYARVFLGHSFFDIECGSFGDFDVEKASRLEAVLDHAWSRHIRLKLTIDLFRAIEESWQTETFPGAIKFSKPNFSVRNGGAFRDMDDFLSSAAGRAHFLRKLDWLATRYARHPGVFGWDLWNEMDAVASNRWQSWTREMLVELKRRFPRHLAMQTLGSMDCDESRRSYVEIMTLPENEISQAHRYLDTGAEWEICHGPIDVMAADAVTTLLRIAPDKPALLSEAGAVEPRHIRPWNLYSRDTDGIVLHDIVFAPFFAGAAGCGQAWHWQEYVDPNDLWWHFTRFARAIEGIDPIEQRLEPRRWDTANLRVYALEGRDVCLAWCRDAASDWRSELVDERHPTVITGARLAPPLSRPAGQPTSFYDPWTDQITSGTVSADGLIALPPFRRSIVARF